MIFRNPFARSPDLRGQTALITGASRGIGRAIAFALAREGVAKLILVARQETRLAQTAEDLRDLGIEVITVTVDLAEPMAVHQKLGPVLRDQGPVDLLINCAGVAHQALFLRSRLADIQSELSTNLLGLYTVTRLVARQMAKRRQGCIVNVTSLMGKIAAPSMATYSATKYAIVGFTQALRSELAPYNVKVIALLPSLTATDMVRDMAWFRWVQASRPEQVAQALVWGIKRGQPEILVGWQSQAAIWASRLLPGLVAYGVGRAAPLPNLYRERAVYP